MTGIILCEGLTDQVLLSKYFCGRFGFAFDLKSTQKAKKLDAVEESSVYSRKGAEFLYVSQTGGKSNLSRALADILEMNRLDAGLFFDYIAVITDRDDDKEAADLTEELQKVLKNYGSMENEQSSDWHTLNLETKGFQEKKKVRFLTIFIPLDHPGALETFLLDSLSKKKENQYIAQESVKFVNSLNDAHNDKKVDFPQGVLSSRRLCVKAPLAVFFGVTNPESTFKGFEDFLNAVDWASYEKIHQGFQSFDCVMNGKIEE